MAYSIVHAEVLPDGSRIFWYAGDDASKPTSGLKKGSFYSATDNGKVYKAIDATTWSELAAGASAWTPTTPGTPLFWLDADQEVYKDAGVTLAADGDTVQQWNDISGNGNHAVQATSGKRPLYKTNQQNGLAVVRHDGTDDCLVIPSLAMTSFTIGLTFFSQNAASPVIIEHSADAGLNAGFYLYAGGIPAIAVNRGGTPTGRNWVSPWTGSSHLKWSTVVIQYGPTGRFRDFQLWVDSNWQLMVVNSTFGAHDVGIGTATADLNIGARNNGATLPLDGDFADVLGYSPSLGFEDATRFGNWMSKKRGIMGAVGE